MESVFKLPINYVTVDVGTFDAAVTLHEIRRPAIAYFRGSVAI
ncbi:MAG TPA: hypothetical protein VGY91_07565 [Chthoniobacterales bacterium]|nr:hypothetical protein [Chthoniobacterales bacterium]